MPLPLTVEAGFTKQAPDTLLGPLARHFDQPQFRHPENVGLAFVLPGGLLERIEDLFPVAFLFHIDEVNDDDPANIPESQLIGDLFYRFEVGLEDRFLQIALSHVPPGVDIHRGQRFSRFDNDVTTRLQPDFLAEGPLDFHLDAIGVKNGFFSVIELHCRLQRGQEGFREIEHLAVLAR